jgi:hypothetical protein
MADDFYSYAASQQIAKLDAAKAQQLADLARAKADADYDSAAQSVQEIANLESARQNVLALHEQYVQSQTPRQLPELSAEEKAAKPLHRMDWNDALDLAKTSKYGKNLTWDDPNVRRGYQEVMARRARGE